MSPPGTFSATTREPIVALYVAKGGAYFGLDGVDPWDEERDARLYDGPYPVVAHPPCARWSLMGLCRGYYDGHDDGCFESALANVRRVGGVLEHPAHTLAWRTFGLPHPAGAGWTQSLTDVGWACEVDQRRYGHEARKADVALLRRGRSAGAAVGSRAAWNMDDRSRAREPPG